MRRACLLAGIIAAAAACAPATPDVVRARSFEMVDEAGTVRATIRMDSAGPAIHLFDRTGRPRLSLADDAEGTSVYLLDTAGTIRVGLAQFAHGGGGLALHGENSRGAAALYYRRGGTLTFYDADSAGTVLLRLPDGRRP